MSQALRFCLFLVCGLRLLTRTASQLVGHTMRRLLSEFNIYRWAGRMLIDASRLRR